MPRGTRGGSASSPETRLCAWLMMAVVGMTCQQCATVVNGESISGVSVTPATGLAPGDAFTATWDYVGESKAQRTTGDLKVFHVYLERCVGGLGTCECLGDEVIPLCSDLPGCVDSDGSYSLILPEAAELAAAAATAGEVGVASGGEVYQVRISLAFEPSVYACGSGFVMVEDEERESRFGVGEEVDQTQNAAVSAAKLSVFAPQIELIPGQAFTAQWLYYNGVDDVDLLELGLGSAGEFDVDLYSCADEACANGSCGEFVASLCGGDGDDGCYDPGTGDYDVVVPKNVRPGTFSLYVKELSKNGPWDCETFQVSNDPSVFSSSSSDLSTDSSSSSSNNSSSSSNSNNNSTGNNRSDGEAKLGSPGVPPVPVPPKQACNSDVPLSFLYESDVGGEGNIVTVEHASGNRTDLGCVTMTDLWEWLSTSPKGVPTGLLYPVNPSTEAAITNALPNNTTSTGVWLLRTTLIVTNGVTLELKGTIAGGDCDELKISSYSTKIHAVKGYGGNIDIYKTKIQSWKETELAPHALSKYSTGDEPRSHIACLSEIFNESHTCGKGAARFDMGECRMDMVDSELGYLGYFGVESYGITWKVLGYCTDKSNPEVFDHVNVYGDITNCDIHHMWYGMYSYGHQGGVWTNNLMHDNHVYGFDPHDDSDYLTIHNNTVYNNAKHGIIASKRCNHVSVRGNRVDASGGSGIMLHRSCDDSEVIGNVVYGSGDAGIALVETSRTIVKDNLFADGKWGARLTLGSTDNMLHDNVFTNNTQRELYLYLGSDEPEVAPYTGRNFNNTFDSNVINYITSGAVNCVNSDSTIVTNNDFVGTGSYFVFDDCFETVVAGNTGPIVDSDEHRVIEGSCFAEPTTNSLLEPTC